MVSNQNQVKENKTAVVNIDDAAGMFMLEHASCRKITYAIEQQAAVRALAISVLSGGATFTLQGDFGKMSLQLRITGIFNVYNVMAAVGAALAEGINPECIQAALEAFVSVPRQV